MPHEIVFSPGAKAWLNEKLDEIRIDNEAKAQAILDKIEEKCRFLAQFPNMTQGGRGVTPGTRHVFVEGLTMTIRVKETEVEILAVRAQRQEDSLSPKEALTDEEVDEDDIEPSEGSSVGPP